MVQIRRIGVYIAAIILALWILLPISWMVSSSLQTETELHSRPPNYLPRNPSVENFWFIFNVEEAMKRRLEAGVTFFLPAVAGELPVALRNSTIVAVVIVAINLVLGTNTAYAFSRTKFRGSYKLFLVTICTRLLPEVGIIIPFFLIIRSLGLLDTLFALILIHSALTLPFSIWILTSYLSNVPTDIEDSARVDGYSRMETLYKVVLPIISPGLVAIGIFSFMLSYRDFIFAFFLTQTMASHTVPVVIAAMTANPVMPIGLMAAAGIITMIPPVVIIVLFRRYIIRGLVSGATVR